MLTQQTLKNLRSPEETVWGVGGCAGVVVWKSYLDVNGEVLEFSNISVVADKVSGRVKVGQYSDMLDYFNSSYDVYNTAYKKTGIDSFKINRDGLFLIELPNCQAMIDAMWGTNDWICRVIKELRGAEDGIKR